jgi:membrane-bound serine protease (ClpP class)
MVGSIGTVREPLNPDGMVFVEGALWQATSTTGPLAAGVQVRVVAVDGLRLRVAPVTLDEPKTIAGPWTAAS